MSGDSGDGCKTAWWSAVGGAALEKAGESTNGGRSPRQTLTKFTLDDLLHQNTSVRKVRRRKVGASCFPALDRWTEVCSEDAGEEGAQ